MFRIRKISDDFWSANQSAISQVQSIISGQFPTARKKDIEAIPARLHDPIKFGYQTLLFVAEKSGGKVAGFAILLLFVKEKFAWLEYVSVAPGPNGGGVGGALYQKVRDEAKSLKVEGLFFECCVDESSMIHDQSLLAQNILRMRFYERYGARPMVGNDYCKPLYPDDQDLYYMMFDPLDQDEKKPERSLVRKVVRKILLAKYADLYTPYAINKLAYSFKANPVRLRDPRYYRNHEQFHKIRKNSTNKIALLMNPASSLHVVRDRGYVEMPVRIPAIFKELMKTDLFQIKKFRQASDKLITRVHDKNMFLFLKRAAKELKDNQTVYPEVFPIRNPGRLPEKLHHQMGYYCIDGYTPISRNSFLAAREAVNCAVTGASLLLEDFDIAYALVRPPGHHAERRVFGGYCYLNSAAIAAEYLSDFGKVAILDIDYHHGNGIQDIFYHRSDVFTASIHADPSVAYPHFSGFAEETGQKKGEGYNLNLPLPETINNKRYFNAIDKAVSAIKKFKPDFFIIVLGLDTAKSDPTGSWPLKPEDYRIIGGKLGALRVSTLIVQSGGYRTRTLGINVRSFFNGFWDSHQEKSVL
jgi:acetoin utilization deacetylase AcuC-like enzyme/GNAT superfamily N-acetyltransferase